LVDEADFSCDAGTVKDGLPKPFAVPYMNAHTADFAVIHLETEIGVLIESSRHMEANRLVRTECSMPEPLTSAPVLQTERLTLRGPERSDLPLFTRFMTRSPRMQAQDETVSEEQAWFAFLTGIGHWHWHGFGFFALVPRNGSSLIGRVGLLKHSGWPQVELAWHLFDGAEGNGYATEAAEAVRIWAQRCHGLNQLVSYIHHENRRSQAVAKRLGAVTDGTRPDHEPDAEIWVHPKAD